MVPIGIVGSSTLDDSPFAGEPLALMIYAPAFKKLVDDAKARIREVTVDDVKARLDRGDTFWFIDIREESEHAKERIVDPAASKNALYIGRGIIERDIEGAIPDLGADIVLYCGGGGRSALAAESLQRMGYTTVASMAGGLRGWKDKGFPTAKT